MPDLRLSPVTVVITPYETRIIHDFTFSVSQSARSVNSDTGFEKAPPVALVRVLRACRIMYLRRRFRTRACIVLTKNVVTGGRSVR